MLGTRGAFLLDSLEQDDRDYLGKIHPSFLGGEYLPTSAISLHID